MEKKHDTFIYEGLGFPIELIDCPMKKMLGEWVIDVNMTALQRFVFRRLVHKLHPLTGKEIRFMRKFMELSTIQLGKKLAISHSTVVKWENEQAKIAPIQESYLRMFFCELLTKAELMAIFNEIRPDNLAGSKASEHIPFQVKTKDLEAASF
jgi:DNA-binding transcriptional regulator YiaG